jgi:hypothetical protein
MWLVYLGPQSYLTTINLHYTIFKVLIIYSKAQLYDKGNDIRTEIIKKYFHIKLSAFFFFGIGATANLPGLLGCVAVIWSSV